MEYVIVNFDESCGVCIDGNLSGTTNTTLMVQEGHHEFKLEAVLYEPESHEEMIQNTTAEHPQVIKFHKIDNGDPQ